VTLSDVTSLRIGHATSPDGITWTKTGQFLAPDGVSGSFMENMVGEPGVTVLGSTMYLYFTAIGTDAALSNTLQSIGRTSSTNGTTWTTPVQALRPDQTLYPRATYAGFSTPQPTTYDGKILLFYDVAQDSPWTQVLVGNAISVDGLTSWSYNFAPTIGRDQAWRSREVRSPSALQDNEGLHLWFAGDNGTDLGIGYAKLLDGAAAAPPPSAGSGNGYPFGSRLDPYASGSSGPTTRTRTSTTSSRRNTTPGRPTSFASLPRRSGASRSARTGRSSPRPAIRRCPRAWATPCCWPSSWMAMTPMRARSSTASTSS
jgi:hypothetical protein